MIITGMIMLMPYNTPSCIFARQEHEKTHSGERALPQVIKQTFDIPTSVAREKLKALKAGCSYCQTNLALPKSTPAALIASEHFGERILVDCKTVTGRGYLVVAVDHFTSYVWSTFVKKKLAQPIADFVKSVWGNVGLIWEKRPKVDGDVDPKSSGLSFSSAIGKVRVHLRLGPRDLPPHLVKLTHVYKLRPMQTTEYRNRRFARGASVPIHIMG